MIKLAEGLVKSQSSARREALSLPTATPSVREEVFRRLNRARDFILSGDLTEMDLESISSRAFLSPYHFHRLFRQAYGETPLSFLNTVRLRKAKALLSQGHLSVEEVCLKVGFSSVPSFVSWFKRAEGVTPGLFGRRV